MMPSLRDSMTGEAFLRKLREHGVLASSMGRQTIRIVFHLDVSDGQMESRCRSARAQPGAGDPGQGGYEGARSGGEE